METTSGMSGGPPSTDTKAAGWGSAEILGFLAFAGAFIIAGLAFLPAPYGKSFGIAYGAGTFTLAGGSAFYTLAVIFGGLALLIAGYMTLKQGHQFKGTAFVTYGLFWIAFPIAASAGNPTYSLSAFMFVFMMISLTFLIASLKHGWSTFFVFLLTFVAFILWVVMFWQLAPTNTTPGSFSKGESWAIGGELILTGLAAWYLATAQLTNSSWGRKVFPG